MRGAIVFVVLAACGGGKSGPMTPEDAAANAHDGDKITVIGQVHTVTFDSTQSTARKLQLASHPDPVAWVLEQDDELMRAAAPAYNDAGAKYPRTPDHYILIRTQVPDGITLGQP